MTPRLYDPAQSSSSRLEDVGDQARGAGPDARTFTSWRLQEAAGGARHVNIPHPPRDHGGDEEILLDEVPARDSPMRSLLRGMIAVWGWAGRADVGTGP